MKYPLRSILSGITMLLVFIAYAFMVQPLSLELYTWSVVILGVGGGIYMVMGYVPLGKGFKYALMVVAVISSIVIGAVIFAIWIAPIIVEITLGA